MIFCVVLCCIFGLLFVLYSLMIFLPYLTQIFRKEPLQAVSVNVLRTQECL